MYGLKNFRHTDSLGAILCDMCEYFTLMHMCIVPPIVVLLMHCICIRGKLIRRRRRRSERRNRPNENWSQHSVESESSWTTRYLWNKRFQIKQTIANLPSCTNYEKSMKLWLDSNKIYRNCGGISIRCDVIFKLHVIKKLRDRFIDRRRRWWQTIYPILRP